MATVIEEQTSTVWKKIQSNFLHPFYIHVFSTLSTQGRNGNTEWRYLWHRSDREKELKKTCQIGVFTWCHTTIWRILFSLTKNGFFKLCHLTKNFRISESPVQSVFWCAAVLRGKKIRILLLRNFFKWTKVKNIAGISFWISNWERFVTKRQAPCAIYGL